MPDLTGIPQPCQRVSKKRLDFTVRRPKLCSAVTITDCGFTVRLLGVSSLNLGRAQSAAHFFAYAQRTRRSVIEFAVGTDPCIGLDVGLCRNFAVDRREVGPSRIEQLLEIVDHEIGLLEIVDAVAGPHHPPQVETNSVWPRVFETIDRLPGGRKDARAIDAQAFSGCDQSELDGVPVQPGQMLQMPET